MTETQQIVDDTLRTVLKHLMIQFQNGQSSADLFTGLLQVVDRIERNRGESIYEERLKAVEEKVLSLWKKKELEKFKQPA